MRDKATLFWAKVDKSGDCWNWTASLCNTGKWRYGQTGITQLPKTAHRAAWQLTYGNHPCLRGPMLPHICVLHRCDNTRCVRPDHLFLGTLKNNSEDMVRKGRSPKGDRQGLHVHPERAARGERNGATRFPENFQGERNGMAKLKVADVLEIRRRADQGEEHKSIALTFNVCRASVTLIAQRKSWRSVTS